ncbi:MAG: DNA translocase FtsK [Lachnospiraceae bacterium]|nr:DNA translocase FtsK [Lachnospiraceae bacterium]
MFGVFGLPAYITPPLIFFAVLFGYANQGSRDGAVKIGAGTAIYLSLEVISSLLAGRVQEMPSYSPGDIYDACGKGLDGGGLIGDSLAYASYNGLSIVGTVLLLILVIFLGLVFITGGTFLRWVKDGGRLMADKTSDQMHDMRRRSRERRQINRERQIRLEEEKRLAIEQKEDEQILRRDRKAIGITLDTKLERDPEPALEMKEHGSLFVPNGEDVRDDVHEINVHRYSDDQTDLPALTGPGADRTGGMDEEDPYSIKGNIREVRPQEGYEDTKRQTSDDYAPESVFGIPQKPVTERANTVRIIEPEPADEQPEPEAPEELPMPEEILPAPKPAAPKKPRAQKPSPAAAGTKPDGRQKAYQFPPIDLLRPGKGGGGDSEKTLRETAARLEEILATFGVGAHVTDISQGPTVTRYELQPDAGIKVSKILGLIDDIKLNLAATDIRIEAPIPGKAAIGIEVPNKSNEIVYFRDVVDSQDFRASKSKIAFAAGKDLAGKPVMADIFKMPHVLIAGATGSGKSVCINTIIMSILYRATPDEVKMIMIDPKVVELSVYNGIPHLLIPVVTDPQKAATALNWAVAEMTNRFKLFADTGVRDLPGYNARIDKLPEAERGQKLPQILVIVDELADLMMTCANDVEHAIVRLTQLARAAGIHLVIATQRPSVDVITGLIKANMPSRIAFAVTSQVDSRTILDMVGAERLLGKGDMLFFPQGYTRPARVQGAFVSDDEVSDVVDFIKAQGYRPADSAQIEAQMSSFESAGGNLSAGGDDDRDAFFEDAARLVIGKDKASIGMLQRVFKVGFNRAARIMDQLCEAGVVSEEEGTKPRRVLMSEGEFNAYLNNENGGNDDEE